MQVFGDLRRDRRHAEPRGKGRERGILRIPAMSLHVPLLRWTQFRAHWLGQGKAPPQGGASKKQMQGTGYTLRNPVKTRKTEFRPYAN